MIRSAVRAPVMALAALLLLPGARTASAAIFAVTNNGDSGAGSLRQAILSANLTPAIDEIQFALPIGQHVITPLTPLPVMTTGVDVNGTSQTGYAGVPIVGIDGATAAGIGLRCTVNFCVVRGLAVYGFTTGVAMDGNLFVVKSSYIGLTATGSGGSGNTGGGLSIGGSFGTVGGTLAADRNVISSNGGNGLVIGTLATSNLIYNNFIGTNVDGTAALGNGSYGIRDFGVGNQIGTNLAGAGNLVSGNARGISLESADPDGTSVRGNFIGLNAAGTAKVPNGSGIELHSSDNEIGGSFVGDRNVISGNDNDGISIDADATDNLIYANYIGTNAAGTAALGNGGYGIRSFGGGNEIGSATAGSGNVISGNGRGISLESGEAVGSDVKGNIIGLNAAGTAKVPNHLGSGIELRSSGNVIGGTTAGDRNIISGNSGDAVSIGFDATDNTIQGNYFGTDITGTVALGNDTYGLDVSGSGNQIGGAAAGAGNLVSDNAAGVDVGGNDNIIEGNRIGTNAAGTADLGNAGSGVQLHGSTNHVGSNVAGAGNLISGNDNGIYVIDGTGNVIEGNHIGTNAAGTAAIANNSYAIRLIGATGTIIGGAAAGAGNLMSGNGRGIAFDDDAPGNTLQGNIIGLTADGQAPLGNADSGLEINSSDNDIGGVDAGAGNVIASNTLPKCQF